MSDNGENWDDPEWVLSKLADEQLTSLRRDREWDDYYKKLDGIFEKVSERLRGDQVFLLKAVEEHGWALKYASPELKKDREIVLRAVKNKGEALQYASKELKNDREFVLQAVKYDGYALEFASDELKKDREVVLQAVKKNGHALEYASDELKKDREFVLQAVKNSVYAFLYSSVELKKDREIALQAVKNNGFALHLVSAELKKDREFVLQAFKNNSKVLEYALDELKKDRQFVLQAVKIDGYALRYASDELKRDLEIATAAAAQTKDALQFVPENIIPDVEAILVPMKRQPRPRKILADRPGGEDQLDLKLMAYAIADILVSKNLSTPFVTGLFGDWGSGKSFLIHLIEQRLGEIMSQDLRKPEFENIEDYPFCGHIYTVHFNAWTYSKEELWASLMYRILYDLNEQLDLEAHIRSLPGDFCMRGVDFIDLKEQLRSKEMKEAFKKYTTKELAGLSYQPKKDGKASKELIRVLNKAYRGDVEELPRKIEELERLNARINRKHWKSSIWKTTEEHFRSELKIFRESNPSDESIADMLKSVGILKRWSKLLLGGINRSPASLLFIILMAACAIAVTALVLTDNMGELSDKMTAFYSGIGAFLSLGVGTAVSTIQKAKKALGDLGVTGAILSADAAVEKVEDSLAAMEEGEPGKSDLAQRHRLECEITAMKNRRWLVEGDSLHDQVRDRLKLANYEDRLGIVHQAQEDLEMLSRAMNLAYKEGSTGKSERVETPETSEQALLSHKATYGTFEQKERHLEEVDDSSNANEWSCWEKLLVTVCPFWGFGCVGCFHIWLFVLPKFVSSKFSALWNSCTDIIGKFVTAVLDVKTKICSSRFCQVISWGTLFSLFQAADIQVADMDMDDFKGIISNGFGVKFEERKENKSNPQERKEEARFPRGKPRIVLFIDDLDRCPPEKVVDVIEALQLLLDRTDVFVAILALDVRYVTRALEKQYKDILIKDSEPSGLQYLQKIIQLPFSVPRMSPDGIKNYFEHQLSHQGRNKENSKKSLHDNSSDTTESDEEKEPEVLNSDVVIEEGGSTSSAINEEGGRIYCQNDEVSSVGLSLTMPDVDEASITSPEKEQAAPSFVEKEEGSLSKEEITNARTNSPDNADDNRKNPSESYSSELENGDKDSPTHQGDEVSKDEVTTLFEEQQEQEENNYIFANEEQEFSDEEVEMITMAGQAARINPRSGRMIANVFKVLKNIWARKNDEPENSIKQAILHLLSYAASNQLLMGRILANLEDELISTHDVGEKTLHQFWMDQLRNCPPSHRPNNHRLFGKTSETWGNVTLEKIGYEDVRLMRSFSFVGYLTSVEDMLTEATEDESEQQQQQQQELQHLLEQLQQQQQQLQQQQQQQHLQLQQQQDLQLQHLQQQQQHRIGVTFIRGSHSLSLIPSDVATSSTGLDLLRKATSLSSKAKNPTFTFSPEDKEALGRNQKEIFFMVNGLRLSKDQFLETPMCDIVYGDVRSVDITICLDAKSSIETFPEEDLALFLV